MGARHGDVVAGIVDDVPLRACSALVALVPVAFVEVTAGPLADNYQDPSCCTQHQRAAAAATAEG